MKSIGAVLVKIRVRCGSPLPAEAQPGMTAWRRSYRRRNVVEGVNAKLNGGFVNIQQKLVIEVHDTGGGIPADEQAHVFERIFRVNSLRERRSHPPPRTCGGSR